MSVLSTSVHLRSYQPQTWWVTLSEISMMIQVLLGRGTQISSFIPRPMKGSRNESLGEVLVIDWHIHILVWSGKLGGRTLQGSTRYTLWYAHDLSLLVTGYTLRSRTFELLFGWERAGHKISTQLKPNEWMWSWDHHWPGETKSNSQRRRFTPHPVRLATNAKRGRGNRSARRT